MKSKFKKTEHTPSPWKVRKSTDIITVKAGKVEIGTFVQRYYSADQDLKTCIANAAISSTAPEMLEFMKEFIGSMETDIEKRKKLHQVLYKQAFKIIEKAQDTEVPQKTYYYYIKHPPKEMANNVTYICEPTFLIEQQAFNPDQHKYRQIKKIEAKNMKEAKEKIFNAKKHIPVKLTDKRPNADQD